MSDSQWMWRVSQRLTQLQIPVSVFPLEDSGTEDKLRQASDDGAQVVKVDQGTFALVCGPGVPGAEEILRLAASLAMEMRPTARTPSESDFYRDILTDRIGRQEIQMLLKTYLAASDQPRSVILLQAEQPRIPGSLAALQDMLPLQDGDKIVELSDDSLGLIKNLTDMNTDDDILQYVQALMGTMLDETGLLFTAGIGSRVASIYELNKSFLEAQMALRIGAVYKKQTRVYLYDAMVLERFLYDIPEQLTYPYLAHFFNKETEKMLDEEMTATIEVFFEKDLNLSDTARQLFIHRNTLVYRLDKIQKVTGLDLKSFHDAVLFKLLLEMRKRSIGARKGTEK